VLGSALALRAKRVYRASTARVLNGLKGSCPNCAVPDRAGPGRPFGHLYITTYSVLLPLQKRARKIADVQFLNLNNLNQGLKYPITISNTNYKIPNLIHVVRGNVHRYLSGTKCSKYLVQCKSIITRYVLVRCHGSKKYYK
jgi:hypothetical protein